MSDEDVRVYMREHFLRTLNCFNGKFVKNSVKLLSCYKLLLLPFLGEAAVFIMHENMKLTGQFGCSNSDLKHVYATDLKTPIGVCKDTLLRCSDIIAIEFKRPHSLSLTFPPES